MPSMDIFSGDAFSQVELTAAVNRVSYVPNLLESLNLFAPKPIRTLAVAVEKTDTLLAVIQTSPRGAPLKVRTDQRRDIRYFPTSRIAKADHLTASAIQSIRAFGSETEFKQTQDEVMIKAMALRGEVNLTKENMRLGAIQGAVLDADGSTIINWATAWGITLPTEIDFDLDNATPAEGALARKCTEVVRGMQRAAKGSWLPGTYAAALVSDLFFDQLISHKEYRAYKLANPAAAQDLAQTMAWNEVYFGGIRWINYRGTDDNSTVAVGAGKAKFFPINAPGVFEVAYSPLESLSMANTPGADIYAMTIPDTSGRDMFVDIEVYSYPLFMCLRPEVLFSGRNT